MTFRVCVCRAGDVRVCEAEPAVQGERRPRADPRRADERRRRPRRAEVEDGGHERQGRQGLRGRRRRARLRARRDDEDHRGGAARRPGEWGGGGQGLGRESAGGWAPDARHYRHPTFYRHLTLYTLQSTHNINFWILWVGQTILCLVWTICHECRVAVNFVIMVLRVPVLIVAF